MLISGLFTLRYPPMVPCFCKETSGSPQFPSYPFENMPWSQTPVVTCTLAITHTSLLPSDTIQRVGFRSAMRRLSLRTTIIHFSGLNTEPANSLHPASDSRHRFCPWTSLMSCWLNFTHVGLPQILPLSAGASSAMRFTARSILPNARASPAERCIVLHYVRSPTG
jgi:hypothetical protein